MLENPRNSLVPHIIASGASYVYIFNEQNFIKTLYPDRSILMVQKLVEYAKIQKNETFWVLFKQCGVQQNSEVSNKNLSI